MSLSHGHLFRHSIKLYMLGIFNFILFYIRDSNIYLPVKECILTLSKKTPLH
jgi:hypothetical protein